MLSDLSLQLLSINIAACITPANNLKRALARLVMAVIGCFLPWLNFRLDGINVRGMFFPFLRGYAEIAVSNT
jgi:hypothetical protein